MRKIQFILILMLMVSVLSAKTKEEWQSLFNGKDLNGWRQLNGKAQYHVEKGEIVGTTVSNTPNSFLATNKNYGDFNALVARSKYAEFENFGRIKEAPILLQYHGNQVKFRSLKIKKL